MEQSLINNANELVTLFAPKKYSPKWLWRIIKNDLRASYTLKLFKFIANLFVIAKLKLSDLKLVLLRKVIAISNGIEVFWELFKVAFLLNIDGETWAEIKQSQFLRQALGFGTLVTIVWFSICIKTEFGLYSIIFFSYQGLRFLGFLGMQQIVKQPPAPEVVKGATRQIRTADEIYGNEEEEFD